MELDTVFYKIWSLRNLLECWFIYSVYFLKITIKQSKLRSISKNLPYTLLCCCYYNCSHRICCGVQSNNKIEPMVGLLWYINKKNKLPHKLLILLCDEEIDLFSPVIFCLWHCSNKTSDLYFTLWWWVGVFVFVGLHITVCLVTNLNASFVILVLWFLVLVYCVAA